MKLMIILERYIFIRWIYEADILLVECKLCKMQISPLSSRLLTVTLYVKIAHFQNAPILCLWGSVKIWVTN